MSDWSKKFYIAGVQHHQLNQVINELEEGDELTLVVEPDNKYDPNAIRIEADGTMCGYVPKKFSSEVAGLLEIGRDLECIITKLDPNAKPWEQCEVELRPYADTEEADLEELLESEEEEEV